MRFYVGREYSLLNINEKHSIGSSTDISYKHDINDFLLILGWAF
jgi:hypothetical protein